VTPKRPVKPIIYELPERPQSSDAVVLLLVITLRLQECSTLVFQSRIHLNIYEVIYPFIVTETLSVDS
jgi:hypothetical protein